MADFWDHTDITKAKAMLRQRRTDGNPRYTVEDVAKYIGMPVARIKAIKANLPVGGNRAHG